MTTQLHGRRRIRPATLALAAFAAVWTATLVAPPVAFLRWREGRLATLAEPSAQENWDAFREDMRRQSGPTGPVQRKVPRSAEPPERVWLRDYPWLAVTAWVTFAGVLGGCLGLLLLGSLTGTNMAGTKAPRLGSASAAQDEAGRQGDHQEQNDRDAEHAEKGIHRSPPRGIAGSRGGRPPERREM
jgi:hypothetical protein